MTVEHRYLVELIDVRRLTFECKKCRTRMSIAPTDQLYAENGRQCPHCGTQWWAPAVPRPATLTMNHLIELLLSLPAVITADDATYGCRVFLEVDEPR